MPCPSMPIAASARCCSLDRRALVADPEQAIAASFSPLPVADTLEPACRVPAASCPTQRSTWVMEPGSDDLVGALGRLAAQAAATARSAAETASRELSGALGRDAPLRWPASLSVSGPVVPQPYFVEGHKLSWQVGGRGSRAAGAVLDANRRRPLAFWRLDTPSLCLPPCIPCRRTATWRPARCLWRARCSCTGRCPARRRWWACRRRRTRGPAGTVCCRRVRLGCRAGLLRWVQGVHG